jgi:hypothetical protein
MDKTVTEFLDALNHPFRAEIEELRKIILSSHISISENIKWNGPNYCLNDEDRITMSIQPPKQIRIIFHCGAKVREAPKEKLIKNDFGILVWKGNDRAIASFKSMKEIDMQKSNLVKLVAAWLKASTN